MNKCLALCFCFLSIFAAAAEEPFAIGEVLPSFKAKDQHGQEFELQPGVHITADSPRLNVRLASPSHG